MDSLGQAGRPADRRRQAGRRLSRPRPRSPPTDAPFEGVDSRAWSCATRCAGSTATASPCPLLAGDHVTDDAGTGFVHTAPGHGADDYESGSAPRASTGSPRPSIRGRRLHRARALFGGLKVLETEGKAGNAANSAVIDKLIEAGTLLARGGWSTATRTPGAPRRR